MDSPSEELRIGRQCIRYRCPPSSEALLDELAERDANDPDLRDERLPYWADLWPSCRAMIHAVQAHASDFNGAQVIELGAGLGLAGIAAGLAGADVLLTDYSTEALDFAAGNWAQNLDLPARTRILDWRDPPSDLRADILLASDVAYEERFFAPLIDTFQRLLRPGGKILLTEPRRSVGQGFFTLLRRSGFRLTTTPINVDSTRINLHVIRPLDTSSQYDTSTRLPLGGD